jgi:hypothetical protein
MKEKPNTTQNGIQPFYYHNMTFYYSFSFPVIKIDPFGLSIRQTIESYGKRYFNH